MITRLLVVLVVVGMLMGCGVNPSQVSNDYANEMARKLTYTYDGRTNLCFAIIASRKTGSASQSGMGITEVPCTEAVKAMIK